MSKHIKGTNVSVSQELAVYLEKKLESLKKFVDYESDAVRFDIELGKTTRRHQTGDIFRAEFNIFVGGKSFRAACESESLHSAIDLVKDEILPALRADKNKRMSLLRRSGERIKLFIKGLYKRRR